MKRMFLVFSHTLTKVQERDAKERFGIDEFVEMPDNYKRMWINVNPKLHQAPIRASVNISGWLMSKKINKNDIALVQGDFGATYLLVDWLKKNDIKAVYATTERKIVEKKVDGKVVKTSVFEHIMFREYRGVNE